MDWQSIDWFQLIGGSAGIFSALAFLVKSYLERQQSKDSVKAQLGSAEITVGGTFQESLVRDNADLRKDLFERIKETETQLKLTREELDEWQERAYKSEAELGTVRVRYNQLEEKYSSLKVQYDSMSENVTRLKESETYLRYEIDELMEKVKKLSQEMEKHNGED